MTTKDQISMEEELANIIREHYYEITPPQETRNREIFRKLLSLFESYANKRFSASLPEKKTWTFDEVIGFTPDTYQQELDGYYNQAIDDTVKNYKEKKGWEESGK